MLKRENLNTFSSTFVQLSSLRLPGCGCGRPQRGMWEAVFILDAGDVAVVNDVSDVAVVIDNAEVVVAVVVVVVVDPSSSSPLWRDVADIIVINVV